MSLLNPGTLTEYSGPSRSSGRRSRGTVRVRDPAHGFFIAGSSLDRMNGIYGRVNNEHVRFLGACSGTHSVRLAYRHDSTGWLMVLIDVDPADLDSDSDDDDVRYGFKERCDMQWRFIDDGGLDRFRHKGDTIIPGAGVRWKHIPLPTPQDVLKGSKASTGRSSLDVSSSSSSSDSDDNDSDANIIDVDKDEKQPHALDDVSLGNDNDESNNNADANASGDNALVEVKDETDEYDEDELPWQVIALLDRSVLEDLRFSSKCRDEKVARSLKGLDVEQPPESSTVEGFLEAERRVLRSIESGMDDDDGGGDDSDYHPVAKGWLYRVTAEEGVQLYTSPSDDDDSDDSVTDESRMVVDDASSTDDERRIVGMRSKDDYVRVVREKGQWLCLAKTEPPLREVPLAVGDQVRVISGHYRGERGEITKEMPDAREFGVNLKGYTGTGCLHVSNLVRDGPHPLSRSAVKEARRKKKQEAILLLEERRRKREARKRERDIMLQYYGEMYRDYLPHYLDGDKDNDSDNTSDEEAEERSGSLFAENDGSDDDAPDYDDAYNGKLWVKMHQDDGSDPALERIPGHAIASLRAGVERDGAELFDKPFEPRLEAESSHSTGGIDNDENIEELDDVEHDIPDPLQASNAPASLFNGSSTTVPVKPVPQSNERDKLDVGSLVCLHGLRSSAKYNSRSGVIITKLNADGRYGVRLNPKRKGDVQTDECNKTLLLLSKNIAVLDHEHHRLDLSQHLDAEEQRHATLSARVLNVHADAIGLGNSNVDVEDCNKVLDSFLRSIERDTQPHVPPIANASAKRLLSDYLQEAKKAHAALACGIQKVTDGQRADTIGNTSSLLSLSPHGMIASGLLGERAKAALEAALDKSHLDRAESGLSTLNAILKDEQARVLRSQASGGLVPVLNPDWKLTEAEKTAAAGDDNGTIVPNDCLVLRLAIVHILFESLRLSEAASAAKTAVDIYPHSAASNFWNGRCLIREGHRIDGIQAINHCISGCPRDGPGDAWAHREGVKRLRALRRTLKAEFRARDAYERGNFASAAKIYGEMMTEYDGFASDDKWGRAEALVARAACHRRARDMKAALSDCDMALALFPRYPRALFRRGLCLLEDQRPSDALVAFKRTLSA